MSATDISTAVDVAGAEHRVLIYQNEDCFAAVGLETDLLGHGGTPCEALTELIGCIEAQYEYAREIHDMSIVSFPAHKRLFLRWYSARFIEATDNTFRLNDNHLEIIHPTYGEHK